MDDGFLTSLEVAQILRVSEATVKRWRREGTGPRHVQTGGLIRYRRTDVQAWLDEHTIEPQDGSR